MKGSVSKLSFLFITNTQYQSPIMIDFRFNSFEMNWGSRVIGQILMPLVNTQRKRAELSFVGMFTYTEMMAIVPLIHTDLR